MDIAILTPIEVEYLAVRKYLTNLREQKIDGIIYEVGNYPGTFHTFEIVIRQTGSKNTDIALATERLIKTFNPGIVLLVGIAGGVKDVAIGDIVIGTKAYGYESGKETDNGFVSRPEVIHYDTELIEQARSLIRRANWQQNWSDETSPPKIVFGPIASGDKVIASKESPIYKLLEKHYNDTIALEMESIGFVRALQPYKQIRSLNIRCISDLLDDKSKTDKFGTQELAASRAAKFTFKILHYLDLRHFKIYAMDMKELIQKVLELVFPFLKSEALKKIGKDFKTATDTSLLELWEKVKPLFIEEIEELKEAPEDEQIAEEVKVTARKKLRKELKENDPFKKELESIIHGLEAKGLESNVAITNSKNIIQGSQISVGRDFKLGDTIEKRKD